METWIAIGFHLFIAVLFSISAAVRLYRGERVEWKAWGLLVWSLAGMGLGLSGPEFVAECMVAVTIACMYFWRPKPVQEEVVFDDEGVRRYWSGHMERVSWDDVIEIGIVTSDGGPWVEDMHWLLMAHDGSGCVVPNGKIGPLFEVLSELDEAAWEEVVAASECVEDASFTVWRGDAGAVRRAWEAFLQSEKLEESLEPSFL